MSPVIKAMGHTAYCKAQQRENPSSEASASSKLMRACSGLIHKTPQAEHVCEHRSGKRVLIVVEQDPMAPVFRRDITFKHAFKELLGLARVTRYLQHVADEPIRDEYEALVAGASSDLGEPLHYRVGRMAFPGDKFHRPLRPEHPQLSLDIIHALGELSRLRRNRPGPVDRPHCQN